MNTPDVLLTTCSGALYLVQSFTVGSKRFVNFHSELVLLNPDGTTKGKCYVEKWEAL